MTPITTIVPHDIEAAQQLLTAALKERGFGVLTEIDLQATFAAKLGREHEGHKILGVCNPQLAKAALDADRNVALLLPCTATLRTVEGGTEVAVLDPEEAFQLAAPDTRAALADLAKDARTRLAAAVEALA
jgi:uncharacterized protein (DUF302 family)